VGRRLDLFPIDEMTREQEIPQHANPRKPWDEFLKSSSRFAAIAS
jgi:hypothetical protein